MKAPMGPPGTTVVNALTAQRQVFSLLLRWLLVSWLFLSVLLHRRHW
jgi:hypothetical protein